MEIVKSYSLYFNTREANSGNSNNCTFIFTTPIVLTNTNNRFMISTPLIELPYSFSQVNTSNYNLPYTYVDNNGVGHSFSSTSMNIPEGNYNINQLQTQLVSSLISDILFHLPSSTLTSNNFNFTYSSQTGFTTMYMTTTGYNVTITLNFTSSYVLGIMNGFPATTVQFGSIIKVTSPNKVMVNPITSVYIRSETLKFQNNYEAIVQTYQNSDVIAKIPVTTLPNSIIYYRNDIKSMISNKFLPSLNLYISDNLSTSYTLDLQGVNYGIMIQLDEVQIKPNNSYQDQLETSILNRPKELLEQRDELMKELIDKKEKLMKQIEEVKARNNKTRDEQVKESKVI